MGDNSARFAGCAPMPMSTDPSAPPSIVPLPAARLGPALAVLGCAALCAVFGVPFGRADIVLCLLGAPRRGRLEPTALPAVVDITLDGLRLPALVGAPSASFGIFDQRMRIGPGDAAIAVREFRTTRIEGDGLARFGAWLRRDRLEALPQLLQVLQRRMSLVGPEPHAAALHEPYRRLIGASMPRQAPKPGLAGGAQVHGLRGDTDSAERLPTRVEYDLAYPRNWSPAPDQQIILRTIALMLRGDEAAPTP